MRSMLYLAGVLGAMMLSGCTAPPEPVVVTTPRTPPRPDRADWPLVVVGPADAAVRHAVTYYPSAGQRATRGELRGLHDPEARVLAVLNGERPGNWNGDNAGALITEPVMAGVDTVLLPVRMVLTPPWVEQKR